MAPVPKWDYAGFRNDGAAMFSVLALFMRGLAQGALAAAACFVVLAVSFAALFFVLVCAAPLKRLQP
jgi:hypothetical protein